MRDVKNVDTKIQMVTKKPGLEGSSGSGGDVSSSTSSPVPSPLLGLSWSVSGVTLLLC